MRSPAGHGEGEKTVTVWLMRGSASEDFVKRFTEDFESRHDGVTLDVRIQEWTGIGAKVTKALDEGRGQEPGAPDVIEVGNTQVPQYVEGDGLLDLSLESARDLGMHDWLPGLAEPGVDTSRQYGIPWYAANRVVIYNKDLFRQAGIDKAPTTRAQWLDMTRELNSGGTQGIYLAGQDWYTLSGFIWDEGGHLAKESSGVWSGTLATPPRCAAWPSTGNSRHSAEAPRMPTRNTRRRPSSSPAATSRRSSPCRAPPSASSRRTRN